MGNSKRRTGCLQFSLRAILVLMTFSALACGLLFAAPAQVSILAVFFVLSLAPIVLTVWVVYGRGYFRTFAIGALFPGTLVLLYSYIIPFALFDMDIGDDSVMTRLAILAYLVGGLIVFCIYGSVAMLARWLVERWQNPVVNSTGQVHLPESPFDAETPSE
jgi:hypothetical protein